MNTDTYCVPTLETRAGDEARGQAVRVLKALALFAVGGTEGQVINLVRHMDRTRFDVEFGCLRREGSLLDDVEQMGISVSEFRISSLRRPHTLRRMLQLASWLQSRQIQVVHSYNFYANTFMIPAAWLAGVPVKIASIRDHGIYLTPAQRRVQKWVCKLADRVLVNAVSIRDWLVDEGFDGNRITIVPNGIDIDKYASPRKACTLRTELGIPCDSPLVVMISRLNYEKGIDDFIDAAGRVAALDRKVRFLVVGGAVHAENNDFVRDDAYIDTLQRRAEQKGLAGKMFFTGFRSDVPDILADAAVSVLPSLSEGTSNSLLESMAAGVPIVATEVGGSPDLLAGGRCGMLVPPHAPSELADAIRALLGNPLLSAKYGQAARQRAQTDFSIQRMVNETQEIYLHELAKHKSIN